MKAADVKLEDMNLKELKELENRLQVAIKDAEVQARKEAYQSMKEAAAQHGLSIEDVLNAQGRGSGSSKGAKVPPKYQNPKNPDQTWSGRGKRPQWIHEHLESGGELNDLLIQKPVATH